MKRIFLLPILALVFGCTESTMQGGFEGRELVEVPLELSLLRVEVTSRGALSQEGSIYTQVVDEAVGKAVNENIVSNVWVLQFDGTAAGSKLIYKNYVANYVDGAGVLVCRSKAAGRVAVVANTFDAAFANGFAVGTATWTTVSAATKDVASQADVLRSSDGTDYLPMSGWYDGVVAVGAAIAVPLTRSVVKLVVNLKSGADLAATAFNVQLCNVPNVTSWFPDRGAGVWPTAPTTVSYAAENMTGITTTGFKSLTFWVPVNRRGSVAGTTAITRATKAPANATYLSIKSDGFWRYEVHLGGDFLTDYNLKANTAYTYNLTLQTDPNQTDSRVKTSPLIGLFGGELVKNSSGEWQFTKPLYVSDSDEAGTPVWATEGTLGATTLLGLNSGNAKFDGRGNTWTINKGHATLASTENYPAANACFKKNVGWASFTSATDARYAWYLPAQDQLMAVWVAHRSLPAAACLNFGLAGASHYWSATEFNAPNAWYVELYGGGMLPQTKPTTIYKNKSRCVREG